MKNLLAKYLEIFPGERERLRELQAFLRGASDPKQLFHRKNFTGHITASGFVLSPDGKKLAVVKHKFLNRYLQPGGHVEEADENILAAARREVREETAMEQCVYLPLTFDPLLPIDIDTHEIPANPKKGEPKHFHHDFRYLFRAEKEIDPSANQPHDESEWIWRELEDAIHEETFQIVLKKLPRPPG